MALFNAEDRARIEQTIAEVERRTRSEIVVLEVARAEPYTELRLLYAASTALVAAALTHLLAPELPVPVLLWLELGAGAALYALLGTDSLLRRLLPRSRVAQATEHRARLELLEQGVLSTRERTGVLILLCELEHRVVILGDSGIHGSVRDGWQGHVDRIVDAIRAGRASDGVCEVIGALGEVLAAHFPPGPENLDEVPNVVRTERQ